MSKVKFEKIKMKVGSWFSAELYINDILVSGEGCHSSQKKKVKLITDKFKKLGKTK